MGIAQAGLRKAGHDAVHDRDIVCNMRRQGTPYRYSGNDNTAKGFPILLW